MIATFPSPVLAVTADAVKDLDGGDALYGLWNIFTKCKESLQDGRRLENISWRLWYREMAASQSYRPLTPESASGGSSDSSTESQYFPSCEVKRPGRPEASPQQPPTLQPSHRPFTRLSSANKNTTPTGLLPTYYPGPSTSYRSFVRQKPGVSAGQIIVDMLPHQPIVSPPRSIPPAGPSEQMVSAGDIVQPQPVLPAVCLPSTPPSAAFPRVVVVNPTPHPTPPATPVLFSGPVSLPVQPPSTHLLPPLPPPALTVPIAHAKRHRPPTPPVQVSPPRPTSPPPTKPNDDTLKASDRRFFLQQSPDSVERGGSRDEASSEGGQAPSSLGLASSGESSTRRRTSEEPPGASTTVTAPPAVPAKRTAGKGARKGKEPVRHAPTRPAVMQRAHSSTVRAHRTKSAQPDVPAKVRPTFNIGSTSSNGSKSAVSGSSKSRGRPQPPLHVPVPAASVPKTRAKVASPPKAAPPQRRPIVLTSTSSEYETDTDDDSWASEEMSTEDRNKSNREDVRLREAALEAQRRRDLFAKVPQRSYSNLGRSKSGLLSQLMNPDPTIFPPSHPYRTSYSSQDFSQLPHRQPGFATPQALQTSKSAAALPLATQMTAMTAQPEAGMKQAGYRPKGRPQSQEIEMDSDSETENPDDAIQISQSVAQEKLAALVGRRRALPERGATMPPPTRPQPPANARSNLTSVSTAPIPLGHPYNLPAPAPPSTPRTTRRQMLATELSESLRRNLLWERQVSKTSMMGGARRQASTGGVIGGALRPLTSTTSEHATASKQSDPKPSTSSNGRDGDPKEERRRRAMARNRSWADDYHYSGW